MGAFVKITLLLLGLHIARCCVLFEATEQISCPSVISNQGTVLDGLLYSNDTTLLDCGNGRKTIALQYTPAVFTTAISGAILPVKSGEPFYVNVDVVASSDNTNLYVSLSMSDGTSWLQCGSTLSGTVSMSGRSFRFTCNLNFTDTPWTTRSFKLERVLYYTNRILLRSLSVEVLGICPATTALLTTQAQLTSSPLTTRPVTSSPLTTRPVTSSPLTTSPITSAALTTNKLTTSPLTTAPLTTNALAYTTNRLTTSPITTQPVSLTSSPLSTGSAATDGNLDSSSESTSPSGPTTADVSSPSETEGEDSETSTTGVDESGGFVLCINFMLLVIVLCV